MKTTSRPLHIPGGSTKPPARLQILKRPGAASPGYGGIGLHCPVNPYPLAPHIQNAVIEAVRGQIAAINTYPDSNATVLRTKLTEYVSNHARIPVTPENIWVANGCNEILQQIFRAFAGPGEPHWAWNRRTDTFR
ncbi:histidinol-phosphate aminotransferase domain protein [Mycobacterium kansasii 732]|nr:histidinol-phosphate aminotransferase domain protein [Mycobacterium kansasii 732]